MRICDHARKERRKRLILSTYLGRGGFGGFPRWICECQRPYLGIEIFSGPETSTVALLLIAEYDEALRSQFEASERDGLAFTP